MKLIIWDFDGVTADTEKYWLAIELEELNKYCGLAWDFATINKYLSGQGLSMQQKVLAELGIYPPAEMWEEIGRRSWQRILDGFNRTPGWIRYWSFRDIAMQWLPAARWRKPCLN